MNAATSNIPVAAAAARGNALGIPPFREMVKEIVDANVIDWIRKEINRIRAFIHSQPQYEALIEVDTLLSVAESEAERHKAIDDDAAPNADSDEPPVGDSGDHT